MHLADRVGRHEARARERRACRRARALRLGRDDRDALAGRAARAHGVFAAPRARGAVGVRSTSTAMTTSVSKQLISWRGGGDMVWVAWARRAAAAGKCLRDRILSNLMKFCRFANVVAGPHFARSFRALLRSNECRVG